MPRRHATTDLVADRSSTSSFNRLWHLLFGDSLVGAGIALTTLAFLINRWAVWAALNEEGYLAWWGVPICFLIFLLAHGGFGLSLGEIVRPRAGKIDARSVVASVLGMLTSLGFALMTLALLIFAGPWATGGTDLSGSKEEGRSLAFVPKTLYDVVNAAGEGDQIWIEHTLAANPIIETPGHQEQRRPLLDAMRDDHRESGNMIIAAAKNDHWELVQWLIEFGRQNEIAHLRVEIAFEQADSLTDLEFLVTSFPRANVPPLTLHQFVQKNDIEAVEFLLAHGAKPTSGNIAYAVSRRQNEMFHLLAAHNVDADIHGVLQEKMEYAKKQEPEYHQYLQQLQTDYIRRRIDD